MRDLIAAVRSLLAEHRRPREDGPAAICGFTCRDRASGLILVCHQLAHDGDQHEDRVYGWRFYPSEPVSITSKHRKHRNPEG